MKVLLSGYLEPISYFIYFGVLIFYVSKIDHRLRYRLICAYYLIATAIMFMANLPGLKVNTHFYNLLYPLTSLTLGYYFYELLQTQLKKAVALASGLVAILYYFSNSFFFSAETLFDSIGHVISSLGVVLLIFMFFHQVMTNVKEEPLSHNFDFWFVCVQLFYHLGAFAIFLSYNYFTRKVLSVEFYSNENRSILTYLWVVHNVLLFLGALTTAFAIVWIYRRKSPSS